MVNNKTTLI